ncbi:ComF family protein [Patescibacteria group bacterium]
MHNRNRKVPQFEKKSPGRKVREAVTKIGSKVIKGICKGIHKLVMRVFVGSPRQRNRRLTKVANNDYFKSKRFVKLNRTKEDFNLKLDKFLENFLVKNPYAQSLMQKFSIRNQTNAIDTAVELYEASGIDLMKEALFEYFSDNGELPDFMSKSSKKVYPDLRAVFKDDPRLHSDTDRALGDYIDNWQNRNVSEEDRYWCEATENVRAGLDEDTENEIAEQFCDEIEDFDDKIDTITLMPSSDPQKPLDNYQMNGIARKVSDSMGIPYQPQVVKRVTQVSRVEKFKGAAKYFGRRAMSEGTVSGRKSDIKGKTILIIDDGWSSGATLDTAKKELYSKGAKKVYSLHISRC